MKKLIGILPLLILFISCIPNKSDQAGFFSSFFNKKQPVIQVALLLDTSSSMDGLINQAKTQLWKIVNELATTSKDGMDSNIQIALYEYGNSTLSVSDGYIRKVVPLTTDLDLVSEKLFELKTQGGDEYCGAVIQKATNNLDWTASFNDLKLIFIAGNERFNQGTVDFEAACKAAIKKGIVVNTIHCGDYQEGINEFWKKGADLADGKYLTINQDEAVVQINTPFDDEIMKLNNSLNKTYLSFGNEGQKKMERQSIQDSNAQQLSPSVAVERAITKSSKTYNNASWDIVDAVEEEAIELEELDTESLPAEMKDLKVEERKEFVEEKRKERLAIQEKINVLNTQRMDFIANENAKSEEAATLDNVLLKAVKSQAKQKNFSVKE